MFPPVIIVNSATGLKMMNVARIRISFACAPASRGQIAIASVNGLEACRRPLELAVQRHRPAAGQRVRIAGLGMDPAKPVTLERQPSEHR